MKSNFKSVDEYMLSFPAEIQCLMRNIRAIIFKNAPHATESISYGIAAYKTHGKPLVYFAGFKNHIGFYATPSGHVHFSKELSKYKQGKGSVQFPFTDFPYDLVEQIVCYRVNENKQNSN